MKPLLLAALLLTVLHDAPAQERAGEAQPALYRCRGADGVTSFQQQPCGEGQLDAGRIPYDPEANPSAPAVPPPPRPAPAPAAPTAPAATATATPTVDAAQENPEDVQPDAAAAPEATLPVASPALFTGVERVSERPSDAVECLRPDSSTYLRRGECERSTLGGEKIEGYVIDEETGQRVWMETVTPQRQIQDPARALSRREACELAKLHIEQIKAGEAPGGIYLSDAEGVRDRHCD